MNRAASARDLVSAAAASIERLATIVSRRALLFLIVAACTATDENNAAAAASRAVAQSQPPAPALALAREAARIRARADSIDAIFQPLPLLRPADEAALQRYGNAQQLAVARRLGIAPGTTAAELDRLLQQRRLVRIADTTDLWVVRRLDYSTPYLTRDAEALLREVARRFQAALAQLGLPRYRLEVTSLLRSAADQERLRRANPNAAAAVSTHQYATTFDVAYSAFAAPAEPFVDPSLPELPWLEPHLVWVAGAVAETVAARRSRELMAILGRVLLALQNEGKVLVTLERLQPVYHMTVARRRTE